MKILIIKLSSLGDVVHAIPAVNALKQIYPGAQIDWLIYRNFSEIIKSQSSINTIHELNDKKLSTLNQTVKKLQKENYDLVIDLQGLMKTALIAKFISANIIGFKQPREKLAACFYKTRVDAGDVMDDSIHVIERNLAIAKFLAKGPCNVSFGELTKAKIKNSNKKICLIPCTTWESKHWSAENWIELAEQLKKEDPLKTEIYILGTIKDLIKIETIICKLRVPFHLVVNKTLQELPEFFSEMDIVIGVDTGPLHIAAATLYGSNAQVIGLYGPTSGARTGPYSFEYISAEDITGIKAKHKRKDDMSMQEIKPNHILKLLYNV